MPRAFLRGLFGDGDRKPPSPAEHARLHTSGVTVARHSLKERITALRPVDVGRGGFDQAIVGESHYQHVLRNLKHDSVITAGDKPIATFFLVREPENPYDRNAIAVVTEAGDIVGYLSREDASQLQPIALEHEQRQDVLSCAGKLVGQDITGVWLNLPYLSDARRRPQPLWKSHRNITISTSAEMSRTLLI